MGNGLETACSPSAATASPERGTVEPTLLFLSLGEHLQTAGAAAAADSHLKQ